MKKVFLAIAVASVFTACNGGDTTPAKTDSPAVVKPDTSKMAPADTSKMAPADTSKKAPADTSKKAK